MSVPHHYRLIVTGLRGSGKTTLIRSLSDIPVASQEGAVGTISMDFGRVTAQSVALYVFGVPGEGGFDIMWDVLDQGLLGMIVLVDARQPHGIGRARDLVASVAAFCTRRFVVALNHRAAVDPPDLDTARAALALDAAIPLVTCVASEAPSALRVLGRFLQQCDTTPDIVTLRAAFDPASVPPEGRSPEE